MDFEAARIKMVDNQIRPTDVTSHAVLAAFLSVPREIFVPEKTKLLAYIDSDIEIAPASAASPARYLMEPSPLAKLLQLAEIDKTDAVLEIGTGTGYAAALLSKVAASVVALESDSSLAGAATENLAGLGCANVTVVTGKLEEGCPAKAPFDVIFVNGAVETVTDALLSQLRDGGRMVVVEGYGNASRARVYVRQHGKTASRPAFNTSVRPLPGFRKLVQFTF